MKFKEPFERTLAVLDVLISVKDVLKAVGASVSRGFLEMLSGGHTRSSSLGAGLLSTSIHTPPSPGLST